MPAVVADAELLAGEVAVAVVGAAAVVPAVRDVAGLALPVLVTLAVHAAGGRVARRALSVSGAVVRTGVDPGQKRGQGGVTKEVFTFCFSIPSGLFLIGNLEKINEYHLA